MGFRCENSPIEEKTSGVPELEKNDEKEQQEEQTVKCVYVSFCPREYIGHNIRMSNWIEAYNPTENVWHRLSCIPGLKDEEILKGFAMVAIDKALYVVGGRVCYKTDHHFNNNNNNNSNTNKDLAEGTNLSEKDIRVRGEVYRLDCVTKNWRQCASLQTPRVDFACSVYNGKIYVAGGRSQTWQEKGVSSAEIYDPELDEWTALPNMSTGRYKCVGVTWENKIHIVGGFAVPEDSDKILPSTTDRSSVEVYDPVSGRWDLAQAMWQLDVPPNQIVTVNDRLYSSGDCLNAWKGHIEAYDNKLNMWKIVDGSHLRNMSHACIINNDHNNNNNNSGENNTFDGVQYERLYLTMAAIGSRLYFLGGYRLPFDSGKCLSTIHVFDTSLEEQRWQSLEPLEDVSKELCSHCCVVTI